MRKSLLLCALLALPVHAAENPQAGLAARAALAFFESHRANYGIPPAAVLELDSVDIRTYSDGTYATVSFKPQRHLGIVVERTELRAGVKLPEGEIVGAGGEWRSDLPASVQPAVTEAAARQALDGKKYSGEVGIFVFAAKDVGAGELVLLPLPLGSPAPLGSSKLALCWRFTAIGTGQPTPSLTIRTDFTVWVDAATGQPVKALPPSSR